MNSIKLECNIKDEIIKEIEFFHKWHTNSKNPNTREKFLKHITKMLRRKNNIFEIKQVK